MRKRKSPIALVTVLVVVASIAFGVQYVSNSASNPAGEQANAPQVADKSETLGEKRPATSTTDVAAQVAGQMASATPQKAKPQPVPGTPSSGPMILNTETQPTTAESKPKPNPTSTSTQWYDKETANGSSN